MAITWAKTWSASDDGTVLGGADLGNLQTSIESDTVQLTGTQSIAGNKTFSGTNVASGTFNITGTLQIGSVAVTPSAAELNYIDGVTSDVVGGAEIVCYEEDMVAYEGDIVYYRDL